MNETVLPCPVVRDLLPLYREKLTEAETSRLLEAHLKGCPRCREQYEILSAEEEEQGRGEKKQVDCLKKVRKRTVLWVLLGIVLTAVLLLGAIGLKAFVIGTPAEGAAVLAQTEPEADGFLTVRFLLTDSAGALRGLQTELREGDLFITGRKVLVSPLSAGYGTMTVPLEGVDRVWAFGKLIWERE